MNEHYHSHHGAILESQHIFIESGLKHITERKKNIRVFEMGMGTALNILCTYIFQQEHNINIDFTSIEKYPLKNEEIDQLNYVEQFQNESKLEAIFSKLHSSAWGEKVLIDSNFTLLKINEDLLEHQFRQTYDLVYFDAFAPDVQMDLWSPQIFKRIFNALNKDGILVTYSVKGIVRRTLKDVGFTLEKLSGPTGGKREILRATKS